MTPAGQDQSQRDVFFQIYKDELAKGIPIAQARADAQVKSEQFASTKSEALNDGLNGSQATVIANKVAQEGKDYDAAVQETTGQNSISTKLQAGAVQLEKFVTENWLVVMIGAILVLASVVFLLFTKTGKQVAKAAIGRPIR